MAGLTDLFDSLVGHLSDGPAESNDVLDEQERSERLVAAMADKDIGTGEDS